jgi:hypothetical protein
MSPHRARRARPEDQKIRVNRSDPRDASPHSARGLVPLDNTTPADASDILSARTMRLGLSTRIAVSIVAPTGFVLEQQLLGFVG